MGEISLLNILMTENLDDRNFIHVICIADTVLTMWRSKKRMFTVTTHGIPKCKPQGCLFLNVDNVGKSLISINWWKLTKKSHVPAGGQADYQCTEGGVIKYLLPREGYDKISGDMRGVKNVMSVEKCFFFIVL